MFSFMQPAAAPVIETLEAFEVVFGSGQSEYNPLRTIASHTKERAVLSRWCLTTAQREAIANGADVYLEMYTFGEPLQPVRLAVGQDVAPEYICEQYALETPVQP